MRFTHNFTLLLTLLCSSHALAADAAVDPTPDTTISSAKPVVTLGYAKYQGIPVVDSASGVTNTNFLGIRFAAPPTGTLRFAVPKAPATTAGVTIAGTQPNRCPMGAIGTATTSPFRTTSTRRELELRSDAELVERQDSLPPFSEDCLFLK